MDDKDIKKAAEDAVARAKRVWGVGWEHIGHEIRMASVTRSIVATMMMAAPNSPVSTIAPIMERASTMVMDDCVNMVRE